MGWIIYNSQGEPLVTQEQHDHTSADASGPMTNDEHDGFSEYEEMSAPSSPDVDKLRIYALDGPSTATGGRATVPAWVESGGKTMMLDGGIYTPTHFNSTNVQASTPFEAQWLRVGNTVTVSGKFNCDPASANVQTIINMSLPVVSNFGSEQDCGGSVGCRTSEGSGLVLADTGNNRAGFQFFPTSVTNAAWGFIYMYQVI